MKLTLSACNNYVVPQFYDQSNGKVAVNEGITGYLNPNK